MVSSLSRAALVRIAPFGLFMGLLALRGMLPDDGSAGMDPRWIYGLSVLAVGGLLLWFWREYGELTMQVLPDAKEALLAVLVGLAVFGLWIYLDAPWMKLGNATAQFIPVDPQGALQWPPPRAARPCPSPRFGLPGGASVEPGRGRRSERPARTHHARNELVLSATETSDPEPTLTTK